MHWITIFRRIFWLTHVFFNINSALVLRNIYGFDNCGQEGFLQMPD